MSHTADTRLKVEGDTLRKLFSAALGGMAEVIKPGLCRTRGVEDFVQEITISSTNQTTLLIDFLSEILTRSHEEKVVFCSAEFLEFDVASLKAKIFGAKTEGFDEDIKAVTYHEAQIMKNKKGNYETTIVFDI